MLKQSDLPRPGDLIATTNGEVIEVTDTAALVINTTSGWFELTPDSIRPVRGPQTRLPDVVGFLAQLPRK